ncbi:MAG: thiamine-phosphate kinase [Candidatus Nezhaarchaeota archaeon]|nr:thiamine-phosphate kinase [Candidatus Nezhaarchaeota archaeon]
MKLAELGERGFVKLVLKELREAGVEAGDDAVFIEIGGLRLAASCDMLVWSTDVPPGVTPYDVGWKAAVSCISDLVAKGARPLAVLLGLGLPASMEVSEALGIFKGAKEAAAEHGAILLGGDTNESPEGVVSVAGIGLLDGPPIRRTGARPGDYLATTGYFGLTGAALNMALRGLEPNDRKLRDKLRRALSKPRARLVEGLTLASLKAATASIDSSDGLAISLHQLAEASGVGFEVEHIPVAREAEDFAMEFGLDLLELALFGGEEYELIVTIPKGRWEEAVEAVRKAGGVLIKIGTTLQERGIYLLSESGARREIACRGWEHFKSARQS